MANKFLDLSGVSHLYGKVKTLIESKTNDTVVSIGNGLEVGTGDYRFYYTTVSGERKIFTLDLPWATESSSGIVSSDQVKAWNAKVDAEDVAFALENGKINLSIGDTAIGSIDTADFVIDGMLQNAELITVATADVTDECPTAGKYLKLTFNTDANSKVIYANVTDLIDVYSVTAGAESSGNYVKITPKVTGSGTVADPWVVTATVDDSALATKITSIDSGISNLQTDIETLQDDLDAITEVGGEPNKVDDVTVDGTSIVSGKVAALVSATTSTAGLMSATDKAKLDEITALTTDEIDAALA